MPRIGGYLILGHVRVPFLQDLDTRNITGDLVSGNDDHPGLNLLAMGGPAADEGPAAVHDDEVWPHGQADLSCRRGNKYVVEGMELMRGL